MVRHAQSIETFGIAQIISARAHRTCTLICACVSRELRILLVMPSPSRESEATPLPRERCDVGERELGRWFVMRSPSGESDAVSISRERDGVGERDVRSVLNIGDSTPREPVGVLGWIERFPPCLRLPPLIL